MEVSRKRATLYNELREALQECSEPDWNGYGCDPVDLKAIDYMKQLLDELPEELLPDSVGACPSSACTAEYYRESKISSMFWVEGSGEIGWLGRESENGRRVSGQGHWSTRDKLIEFIRQELEYALHGDVEA